MDDSQPPEGPDPSRSGRLSREEATALLTSADSALASADFADAAVRYGRVIGFDDAPITAAALLGLGEARYRLGDDAAALASWEAVVKVGETPSTYPAWRNIAAARVRNGDLAGAIEAYRQADYRAPWEDKQEISTRLGWLIKESGDPKAARKYFAKGRGDAPLISVTTILIAATVIVSLSALWSAEGQRLSDALALDKEAVAAGEYWRLWTMTLLHGSEIHLAFNMYALYLSGRVVERWYGPLNMLVFYLVCAAAGSIGSFVLGGAGTSVGASGAVFGLFGLLLAAGRVHHPVDKQSRSLVSQLGMLIVINLLVGFAIPGIDNFAHLGGLAAGLWLGALIPPTKVQTLASLWQPGGEARTAHLAKVPIFATVIAIGVVAIVVIAGLLIGTALWAA
jgi:membrane associated rhomboid family serine protease